MTGKRMITVSVVSHNQAQLVAQLLADLERCHTRSNLQVIVTINSPEPITFADEHFSFPLTILRNKRVKGFGANHNAAFRLCRGDYFCVLNPDIRLAENPFPILLSTFENPKVGLVSSVVVNSVGAMEDSARRLPTPLGILKKCFQKGPQLDYPITAERFFPDWVAGMFMLFPASVFARAGGFDERYFLYYEDVELCARLHLIGYAIALEPATQVIHLARRDSHRRLKFFLLHLRGMLRFFLSRTFFASLRKRFKPRDAIAR